VSRRVERLCRSRVCVKSCWEIRDSFRSRGERMGAGWGQGAGVGGGYGIIEEAKV